jgi:Fe-S oxidoreductase
MDVEYLLFAGCVPSFNPRVRPVLDTIVEALKEGGISFGILGKEEQCCGDPLRKTGNEYVFARLVKANIDLFARYQVKKVITFCPIAITVSRTTTRPSALKSTYSTTHR